VFDPKTYIFFLLFLIILPLESKNFSGLYQGEDCKGKCDFQTAAQDPISSLTQALGLSSKYASFFIEHINESNKLIINHLNTNKNFEAKFDSQNLTFEGMASSKGQIYSIEGSFNGENIGLTITREKKKDGTGKHDDHFMATRTPYSLKGSELLEEYLVMNQSANEKNQSMTKNLEESQKQISNLEGEISKLKKKLAKPIKIDTSGLSASSTVAAKVDLLTKPNNEEGKKILTLEEGDLINHLMPLPPERSWSLITTESGIIGYIKNVFIINSNSYSESTPTAPSDVTEDQIIIYEPSWDKGKKNQTITLNAAGFISIQGVANINNLEKVYINEDEVDLDGNDFNYVIKIEEGSNSIKVSAEDNNGKQIELNFTIKVK
tara:strand:- start:1561 stop:2694 length:1134 start_codon:yes stop_codon:yes gene_type:complete